MPESHAPPLEGDEACLGAREPRALGGGTGIRGADDMKCLLHSLSARPLVHDFCQILTII